MLEIKQFSFRICMQGRYVLENSVPRLTSLEDLKWTAEGLKCRLFLLFVGKCIFSRDLKTPYTELEITHFFNVDIGLACIKNYKNIAD